MKKVANMNDGHTNIEYDSIEELNKSVSAPYLIIPNTRV